MVDPTPINIIQHIHCHGKYVNVSKMFLIVLIASLMSFFSFFLTYYRWYIIFPLPGWMRRRSGRERSTLMGRWVARHRAFTWVLWKIRAPKNWWFTVIFRIRKASKIGQYTVFRQIHMEQWIGLWNIFHQWQCQVLADEQHHFAMPEQQDPKMYSYHLETRWNGHGLAIAAASIWNQGTKGAFVQQPVQLNYGWSGLFWLSTARTRSSRWSCSRLTADLAGWFHSAGPPESGSL